MSQEEKKAKKIVLIGDGGVGKTTYVKRVRTGEFEKRYIPTMGVEVHPFNYKTDRYDRIFNLWDTAGQEKYGGLQEGYWIGAHGFILMFDVTNSLTWKNIPEYIRKIRLEYKNTPIVICGNKVDTFPPPTIDGYIKHPVPLRVIRRFCNEKKCKYYDISAKSCYNYEKPFEYFSNLL